MAWNSQTFSLSSSIAKMYSLTTTLAATASNLSFSITNIYTPSNHQDTHLFFSELSDLDNQIHGPLILACDFNLTRDAQDKNNSMFNFQLAASNDIINDLARQELSLLDCLFTWSNKFQNPMLARLDHVHFNLDFGSAFPNKLPDFKHSHNL
ncbi:unnamed protein product [Urochloa humidicola]